MKQVRIAELKARLSEYLRAVRRGETIAVLDRETLRDVVRGCVAAATPLIAVTRPTLSPLVIGPRAAGKNRANVTVELLAAF